MQQEGSPKGVATRWVNMMKDTSTTNNATQCSPVTSEAIAPKAASAAWVPSIFAKNKAAPTSSTAQQVAHCCCYAAVAILLGCACACACDMCMCACPSMRMCTCPSMCICLCRFMCTTAYCCWHIKSERAVQMCTCSPQLVSISKHVAVNHADT